MDLIIEIFFFGLRILTIAMYAIVILAVGISILNRIKNKFKRD